jgi:hypothetical protein
LAFVDIITLVKKNQLFVMFGAQSLNLFVGFSQNVRLLRYFSMNLSKILKMIKVFWKETRRYFPKIKVYVDSLVLSFEFIGQLYFQSDVFKLQTVWDQSFL